MAVVADTLPLTETHTPEDQAALVALMAGAFAGGTAMYPIGGGTSLDYGLPATTPGLGISLAGLNRVIDYPARDMTITVEAGITLEALTNTLASERQWLPVETPQPASATLGGLVATAWSGPRRYGYGTMRDYVIGISAVDGRGTMFKAGGRVVKNVAGYDFCKLLVGSLGTLGIVSQVTLKIRPIPARTAFLACDLPDLATAEKLLAAIVDSGTTPAAVEVLFGPQWREHESLGVLVAGSIGRLVVGLEGSEGEVAWMLERLAEEWRAMGVTAPRTLVDDHAAALWRDLREFPSLAGAPLVLKASVLPSHSMRFIELVRTLDPQASLTAHAGNGIVIARFAKFEPEDVSRKLIGRLQPAAQLASGGSVVLSSTLAGLTRQAVWGSVAPSTEWMSKVKRKFDPANLLNPGRFVYDFS